MRRVFQPNEDLVAGFQRVVRASGAKVKEYLLARAGLASHDLRVWPATDHPILVEEVGRPSTGGAAEPDPPWPFWNARVDIFNAAPTSATVLEVHFFVELPPHALVGFAPEGEGDPGTVFTAFRGFLGGAHETSPSLPVVGGGTGLRIFERTFGGGLVPRASTGRTAVAGIVEEMDVWLGVVLVNEELLPYRWDRADRRFEPGFFSDGTVVGG